jgi:hypothetical protein
MKLRNLSSSRKVKLLIGYFSDELPEMPKSLEEAVILKKKWLLTEMSSTATFYDLMVVIIDEKKKYIREQNYELVGSTRDRELNLINSYFSQGIDKLSACALFTKKNELIYIHLYARPSVGSR